MKLLKALQWLVSAVVLSALSGCATVDRLSDYRFDPIIDTERNNLLVYLRANVHFLRNGKANSYSAPWGSKQNEPRYDTLLVEVSIPELKYQRRLLLAAHANIARTHAPQHDEHLIAALDDSDKYEVLPWAMLFEEIELAPEGPIEVDFKLTALHLDLNSVLNNTPSLPPLYAQQRIQLSSERLSRLLVPHWPINEGIAAAKRSGSVKSFIRAIRKWNKAKGGDLFGFMSSNSGVDLDFFKATTCYPAVKLSRTHDAFPKPAFEHAYLRPKSYQVDGEDLLHYLAREGEDDWGFIAATNLLDKCTDFQVTDRRGNSFMHNYLYKVRDPKTMDTLLSNKYFGRVCMEPNEEGKNCIDTLLERGYTDRVVELVNKGKPLDYYDREDIAHAAKRALPKEEYRQLLQTLAPLEQECDLLHAAIKRLDKVACSYKDRSGDRHFSKRCDDNKERAITSLRSSSSQVCGHFNSLRREAAKHFGPYERLNFSEDLTNSAARRQFSERDFKRKYPIASIDLKSMAASDFSEVLAEQKRQQQNRASTLIANLQASERSRQAINAPIQQSYQTAKVVAAGIPGPATVQSSTKSAGTRESDKDEQKPASPKSSQCAKFNGMEVLPQKHRVQASGRAAENLDDAKPLATQRARCKAAQVCERVHGLRQFYPGPKPNGDANCSGTTPSGRPAECTVTFEFYCHCEPEKYTAFRGCENYR